jgi:hypothetical protein
LEELRVGTGEVELGWGRRLVKEGRHVRHVGGEVGGRRGGERRTVRISIFDSKSRRFKEKERKKSEEKARVGWKRRKKVTRLGKLGGSQLQIARHWVKLTS